MLMLRICLPALLLASCSVETELAFVKVRSASDRILLVGPESFLSPDGGQTWESIAIPFASDNDYHPFERRDDQVVLPNGGIYSAAGTGLWYSDDWGQHWIQLFDLGERGYVSAIYFFDDEMGLCKEVMDAPQGRHGLFLTRDGGRSWEPVKAFYDIRFATGNGDQAFVLIAGGEIWRSTDRAASWEPFYRFEAQPFAPLAITLFEDTVWVTGMQGFCRRLDTRSGQPAPCGFETEKALFELAAQGSLRIIGAERGSLFLSSDGGSTWREERFDSKYDLTSVAILPGGGAIAAGGKMRDPLGTDAGRIAVMSDDLVTWRRIHPSSGQIQQGR